ncbi:unnamed protein product [Paramecium pentaurelia]|uniref:CUE domain-containing protein n=1 Tax=Paramecium pentaurelia TaxID=43138 RepID=A0A8S1TFC6_9CILI|nr:unnamed protein product [Paramecium pentaurelia]
MKKGKKQKDSIQKQEEQIENCWKAQKLDLKFFEELNLMNQYYPQNKQIFVNELINIQKRTSKIRYVKKRNNNASLIDCRTKQELKQMKESINNQQMEIEKISKINQPIAIDISNNNDAIVISSDESIICLNDIEDYILDDYLSYHDDQQSKTQAQPQIYSRARQPPQIHSDLQYEPEKSSFSSINFSQPLSASLVFKFMNDDVDFQRNFDEWSLSSLESKTPPIKNNQHYNTLLQLQKYFPTISDNQYESLLLAYNNDYKLVLQILQYDQKQIQRLLDKNKNRKKMRI